MRESQRSAVISDTTITFNARSPHGIVIAFLAIGLCSSCTPRHCCELPLQQVCYTPADEERDHALVRMMLASLRVDSVCACEHLLIDPVVKRSHSLLATPSRPLQPLFVLTNEDFTWFRGSTSGVRSIEAGLPTSWPQWHRDAPDTVSMAIFVADTAHQSDPGRRTLSIFVLLPGTGTQLWTWDAWRCEDEWCGGPLKLVAQP